MSVNAQSLGTMFVRLRANTAQYEGAMNSAAATTRRTEKQVSASVKKMASVTTAAMAVIGAISVREFSKFNEAMTKSTAILTGNSQEMRDEMEKTARQLSMQTTTSATEAAESYFFLASAGLDAKQSIAALPVVESFATAGAFDMATATDLATDAQSALGLAVDDSAQNMRNLTRVTDVLVKANTLANATVQQFSESLTSKSGAALRSYNKSVEEGVAVLAAYADQGVKSQLAGENLNRVMLLLSKAAGTNSEVMERYNVQVFDSEGNMKNIADIIEDLENAFDGMSDSARSAALEQMGFQARVQGAILPLIGTSEKVREYERSLNDAAGTTERVAEKQLQSFNAQMKITMNVIREVALFIGDRLAPSFVNASQSIRKMLFDGEDLRQWVKTTADLFSKSFLPVLAAATTALVMLGITKAVTGFIALSRAIWLAVTATRALTAAQMANPLIAVTAVVAGLVVAFSDLNAGIERQTGLVKDHTKEVESLGDAWERADRIASGSAMFDDFDKQISHIQKKLADAVADRDRMMNDLESGVVPEARYPGESEAERVAKAMRGLNIQQSIIDKLKSDLNEITDMQKEAVALDIANRVIEGNRTTIERARIELEKLQASFDPTAKNADTLSQAIEILQSKIKKLEEEARKGSESFVDYDEEARKLKESLDEQFKTTIKDVELYNKLLDKGKITTEEFAQASQRAMGGQPGFTNMLPGQVPTNPNDPFAQISRSEEALQSEYDRKLELIRNNEKLQGETKNQIMAAMESEYNTKMEGFQRQRRDIIMQGSQDVFDGLLSLTSSFAGEQSDIYKAMFAASKAFAIAEAVVKIQQGIAQAAAIPFPANLAAMGTVMSATSGIVSAISGTNMQSFEGGGFTGSGDRVGGADGRGGFPALLHPNEVVTDLRKDGGQGAAPVINIYTLPGQTAETQTSSDGKTIDITIKRTKQEIAADIRRGSGEINKALSQRDKREGLRKR